MFVFWYMIGGGLYRDIIFYFEVRFWIKEILKNRWGYIDLEKKRIECYIYGVWNEEERRVLGGSLGYKKSFKWILEYF